MQARPGDFRGKLTATALLVLVSLLTAGCGNSATPSIRTPRAASVTIKNFRYTPSTVKITVGDSVTWTNSDSATHTVSVDGGSRGKLESGDISQNRTFRKHFTTSGTFAYHCAYHSFMHGVITVASADSGS